MGRLGDSPKAIPPPWSGHGYVTEMTSYRFEQALRMGCLLFTTGTQNTMWCEITIVDGVDVGGARLDALHECLREGKFTDAKYNEDGGIFVKTTALVEIRIDKRGMVFVGCCPDPFTLKDIYPNGPLVHFMRDSVAHLLSQPNE